LRLTPQGAIRLAMEKSQRLMMAKSGLKQAGERVREARSEGLPQLDASVDYTRNWLLPTVTFNDQTFKIGNDNNVAGGLSLTQSLYRGGGIRARLRAARLDVAVNAEVERAVRQQVTADVENGFYDFILASELARVSTLALERARSNRRQVAALRQAGRASEYDLLRATVQVSSVRADSIRAHNDREVAEIRLKDHIGLDLDRDIEVRGSFRESSSADGSDLQKLFAIAAARHPQKRQLEYLIAMEERDIQAEKAESRPRVDLVADGRVQFQNDQLDNAGNADEWRRSWSTGVRVQVPLFDGMQTGARVAQATEERRRLRFEEEKLERAIERQIRESWMDLQEAAERIEVRRGTVEQATRGLGVAESRYNSGVGTQLEILDAQLTLLEAETELATAGRDRAAAIVAVELSAGILGESAEIVSDGGVGAD
jgi:outer membrane protein TolC